MLTKITNYFRWLFKSIKNIFVKEGQQITAEDRQELKTAKEKVCRSSAKLIVQPVIDLLNANYLIPENKLEAIADHTILFVGRNWKHMNAARLARKIAEHFHLPEKKLHAVK